MKKNINIAIVVFFAFGAMSASAQTAGTEGRMYSGGTPCFDESTGKYVCDPATGVRPTAPHTETKGSRAEADAKAKALRQTQQASFGEKARDMRSERKDMRASTTAAIKDMRGEMKINREEMEARAKALRASTTAVLIDMKDQAMKKRLEIAHKRTDFVNARLVAAINRMQTLANRMSTALDNLATKGVNVDASRAKIANARLKLDEARTKAAAIKLAIETAFARATLKIELDKVQPLIKDEEETIQAAHHFIAEAISLVKPGLNKQEQATTTAQ